MNLNQFAMGAEHGMLDLTTNPNPAVMTARFHAIEGGAHVEPGEGVVLTDLGADDTPGPPIVQQRAAAGEAIMGVVILSTKENLRGDTDLVEIAGFGAVVWMRASAALARGAAVTLTVATPGYVEAVGGNELFGRLLDKASAADELVRVLILATNDV